MLRSTLTGLLLPLLALFGTSSVNSLAGPKPESASATTETIEKLIVNSGSVTMHVDLTRLNDAGASTEKPNEAALHFAVAPDSFFTVVVNNNVLRGPLPGSMPLIPQDTVSFPAPLSTSLRQLVLEKRPSSEAFELVVRDATSGFIFFNVEGHHFDYDVAGSAFSINEGQLLVSKEFAKQLGRPVEARAVGTISVVASMRPIEIQTVVNGELQSTVLPPTRNHADTRTQNGPDAITATPTPLPGPDVYVGDLPAMSQPSGTSGISGTFVGLGVATTSCNDGNQPFHWFASPDNDHPVIPQNLYRMSSNTDRFEQIGQSWLKHAFLAEEEDACGLGCNTGGGCTTGSNLCPNCSDPYSASLNYSQTGLGSRAWVNPFTGAYPRADSATPPNNHSGHTHTGTSHRVTVAMSDLNTTLNVGATYYAEGHYVTPHEYTWCQAHPGQCNQYNNVSYRRFNVSSSNQTNFSFTSVGNTVQKQAAIMAWTGATINQFEPAPGTDGIGFVGCKVTNPSAGVWHYEYAVYNENLDRAIQSFRLPLGPGIVVSNVGFHAPPQEPGFANDGTAGNTGFSSTAWPSSVTSTLISWGTEKVDANPNANAIRWGTLYNFRFDANRPPVGGNATLAFFKTGTSADVAVQIPTPDAPTPSPTAAPTATPPPATPTPAPTASPAPTATPTPSGVTVFLPIASVDTSVGNFTQPVTVSAINPSSNLIGFQGDFTFDQTVVTFQSPPVAGAGLTASNWNVSGNVIPGVGPIRTLRISAFSTDGETPLSGAGTLFNLNMTRVSSTPGASTPLTWAAFPNNFVFIDTNLALSAPTTPPGSITIIAATISISGNVDYCPNPSLNPVPGVTLTLTGSASGSALSDGSGNYSFASLASGGTYTVTPTKAGLAAGSAGISTVDVLGVQRHFLGITIIPAGCRLTAADVNGDSAVSTVDVVAIQRFFLGFTTGTANVGKYKFTPASRSYPAVGSNQTAQNYDALVFGDVASGFVHRAESTNAEGAREVPATVAALVLPSVAANQSRSDFTAAVSATAIDGKNNLVGFQADFSFDSSAVQFETEPVQKAGLTNGNWNVAGNVLPGAGRIRTLRISAYSTDFTPLSGEGTLFELKMLKVNNGTQAGPLVWVASPNQFLFIDADLNVQRPGATDGGVLTR